MYMQIIVLDLGIGAFFEHVCVLVQMSLFFISSNLVNLVCCPGV